MKLIASLTLTLAALRHAAATNSTSCTPRLMSYWINANASISVVEPVSAGDGFGEDGNRAYPGNVTNLPSLCAVSFIAKDNAGGQSYKFGLFLPDDWNDNILAIGNEGFDGGVNWPGMAAGVRQGYVTLSTDGGHSSVADDLSWALNDDEAKEDFGHLAVHGAYRLALRVVERYYGAAPVKSYFAGTGNGGRQGLKSAQKYPTDFDAIVVGAPTWSQSSYQSWKISRGAANQPPTDAGHLSDAALTVLGDNVRKQCDKADGVEDGIISSLATCFFDFVYFTCGEDGVDESACLTPEQVETAKLMYTPYEGDNGEIYPGLTPSSEYEWASILGNDTDLDRQAVGYFKYFVENNADWEWTSYDEAAAAKANSTNPGDLDVTDYDLTEFQSLGHKLIMYHGLADGSTSVNASIGFFDSVVAATGGNIEATRDWFRLFLVPGLGHRSTKVDAAWYIGGPGQWEQLENHETATITGFGNPTYDVIAALAAWESAGTVPESIIGTTWATATDPSTEILRQRPACPWPATQKFIGEGDASKAESFVC